MLASWSSMKTSPDLSTKQKNQKLEFSEWLMAGWPAGWIDGQTDGLMVGEMDR